MLRHFHRVHPRSRDEVFRYVLAWIGTAVVGFVGAAIGVALGAEVTSAVGPFDATLTLRPSLSGGTVVRVAPLGRIELDTHEGPLSLYASLDELRPAEAENIVRNPGLLRGVEDQITRDVRAGIHELVLKAIVFGAVGAAVTTTVVVRRPYHVLVGLLSGLLAMSATGIVTAATWDRRSLAEPRYSGLLSRAPAAIGDARDILNRFSEYRGQLSALVLNVTRLYDAASTLPNYQVGEDVVRVLHVSDIHLNPAAFDLMEQLVEQFKVDVIVDTGDIAEWGSPVESRTASNIGPLGVPYVFVRGNHDSTSTADAIRAQPNTVVLTGSTADVAGLRFFGMPDPRFTPDKRENDDTESQRERVEGFSELVAQRLAEQNPPPQVVVLHDPAAATKIRGKTPLVLAGHLHKFKHSDDEGTTTLVEGSTGGAGLRGVEHDDPTPLSASILYLDRATGRLAAYDRITVGGLGEESVNIARKVIEAPAETDDAPATPSPSAPVVAE